ncbi:cellulase family glycosylhydrolase [Breznakibacter xylanolyticus]|nr:cellulase family glycosylhydrolase [Breznakibacter xylanolyticus]
MNKLRKPIHISMTIISLIILTLFSACSDKETTVVPEVQLSHNTFTFDAPGGSETLTITSNIPLELTSSNALWCTVIKGKPSGNSTLYTINTSANATYNARECKIIITGSDYSGEVLITQQGKLKPEPPVIDYHFGMGWNLGNQLDAHSNGVANETIWGNQATTQEAFNKIKAVGIESVRIPVTWLGKVGPAPSYTIDATWLNRVAEVVGYAENAGLKAIINIHHDGAESKFWLNITDAATNAMVNTKIKAQLQAMWTQIANKFMDKGNFLVFEAMNEIHDGKWGWGANLTDGGKQYEVLNEWNQVFVDAVRATGGNNADRYLGVPGYVTSPKLTIDHLVLPNDITPNRLMVSVHYYDPHKYALEDLYSEWGHTAAADKKDSYGDEAEVIAMFEKLKTKYIDQGIPVYIGEMGSVHRSTARAEAFRKYYLEYVCKAAKTYGLAPFYWDNGSAGTGKECLGLINHATGEYINNGKEMIDVMVKAMTNQDASYTLDAVYNSAPQ